MDSISKDSERFPEESPDVTASPRVHFSWMAGLAKVVKAQLEAGTVRHNTKRANLADEARIALKHILKIDQEDKQGFINMLATQDRAIQSRFFDLHYRHPQARHMEFIFLGMARYGLTGINAFLEHRLHPTPAVAAKNTSVSDVQTFVEKLLQAGKPPGEDEAAPSAENIRQEKEKITQFADGVKYLLRHETSTPPSIHGIDLNYFYNVDAETYQNVTGVLRVVCGQTPSQYRFLHDFDALRPSSPNSVAREIKIPGDLDLESFAYTHESHREHLLTQLPREDLLVQQNFYALKKFIRQNCLSDLVLLLLARQLKKPVSCQDYGRSGVVSEMLEKTDTECSSTQLTDWLNKILMGDAKGLDHSPAVVGCCALLGMKPAEVFPQHASLFTEEEDDDEPEDGPLTVRNTAGLKAISYTSPFVDDDADYPLLPPINWHTSKPREDFPLQYGMMEYIMRGPDNGHPHPFPSFVRFMTLRNQNDKKTHNAISFMLTGAVITGKHKANDIQALFSGKFEIVDNKGRPSSMTEMAARLIGEGYTAADLVREWRKPPTPTKPAPDKDGIPNTSHQL